jgi:hypothetical protein
MLTEIKSTENAVNEYRAKQSSLLAAEARNYLHLTNQSQIRFVVINLKN